MDTKKKLKLTAAIAAIMEFEAEQEYAAVPQAQYVPAPAQVVLPLWSMAGRQDAMFTRSLWQRRLGR